MSEAKVEYRGDLGLVGALACVFITLKLCGQVDWSWWWVLAPLWMPAALFLGVAAIALMLAIVSDR